MAWARFTVLLFALGASLYAADVKVNDSLSVTQDQIQEIIQRLPRLDADKVYFHWADEARGWRWVNQGYVDQGELDFLTKPSGTKQNFGGGVYLSENSESSSTYGTVPIAVEFPKGTLLYDREVVHKILGRGLSEQEASDLGRLIPCVRPVGSTWAIFNHARLSSRGRVVYGGKYGAQAQGLSDPLERWKRVQSLVQQDSRHGLLDSLIALSHYQDGLSFVRAMRVNPKNPWAEFEPQHFEGFRLTRNELYTELANGRNLGITTNGSFGEGYATEDRAKQWASDQVDRLLEIQSKLSGRPATLRSAAILAGGSDASGSFVAGPAEVGFLKKNPLLEVEARPRPDHLFEVAYRYRDISGFEALRSKLPEEFVKEVEVAGLERILRDPALKAQYTEKMIRALLESTFRKFYGEQITPKLLQELISIHPFQDFNGRTTRLYYEMGEVESRKPVSLSVISDLDLLTGDYLFSQVQAPGRDMSEKLEGMLIAEALTHILDGRTNYGALSFEETIRSALQVLTGNANPTCGPECYERVRLRRWHPLLSDLAGGDWGLGHYYGFFSALEFVAKEYPNDPSYSVWLLPFFENRLGEFASVLFDGHYPNLPEAHRRVWEKYGIEHVDESRFILPALLGSLRKDKWDPQHPLVRALVDQGKTLGSQMPSHLVGQRKYMPHVSDMILALVEGNPRVEENVVQALSGLRLVERSENHEEPLDTPGIRNLLRTFAKSTDKAKLRQIALDSLVSLRDAHPDSLALYEEYFAELDLHEVALTLILSNGSAQQQKLEGMFVKIAKQTTRENSSQKLRSLEVVHTELQKLGPLSDEVIEAGARAIRLYDRYVVTTDSGLFQALLSALDPQNPTHLGLIQDFIADRMDNANRENTQFLASLLPDSAWLEIQIPLWLQTRDNSKWVQAGEVLKYVKDLDPHTIALLKKRLSDPRYPNSDDTWRKESILWLMDHGDRSPELVEMARKHVYQYMESSLSHKWAAVLPLIERIVKDEGIQGDLIDTYAQNWMTNERTSWLLSLLEKHAKNPAELLGEVVELAAFDLARSGRQLAEFIRSKGFKGREAMRALAKALHAHTNSNDSTTLDPELAYLTEHVATADSDLLRYELHRIHSFRKNELPLTVAALSNRPDLYSNLGGGWPDWVVGDVGQALVKKPQLSLEEGRWLLEKNVYLSVEALEAFVAHLVRDPTLQIELLPRLGELNAGKFISGALVDAMLSSQESSKLEPALETLLVTAKGTSRPREVRQKLLELRLNRHGLSSLSGDRNKILNALEDPRIRKLVAGEKLYFMFNNEFANPTESELLRMLDIYANALKELPPEAADNFSDVVHFIDNSPLIHVPAVADRIRNLLKYSDLFRKPFLLIDLATSQALQLSDLEIFLRHADSLTSKGSERILGLGLWNVLKLDPEGVLRALESRFDLGPVAAQMVQSLLKWGQALSKDPRVRRKILPALATPQSGSNDIDEYFRMLVHGTNLTHFQDSARDQLAQSIRTARESGQKDCLTQLRQVAKQLARKPLNSP